MHFIHLARNNASRFEAVAHYIIVCVQLGPTFSVLVAGKRMTFVTDPDDYGIYFQSPQADFQQAVQPFTERAGRREY